MSDMQQIVVAELPQGELTEAHFAARTAAVPAPDDGELLVRTILMSIDAANRAWMQGATYREAVEAGDVMHTYALGEVTESRADGFAPGDLVAVESRWSEYVVVSARRAMNVPRVPELSHLLSVYGIAGKTAYHGLTRIGQPKAGETVVVSAAAGSVGIYVGQIAKALGCRAVGIAGGADKCAWVTETLGFDACVDYRSPGLFKALRTACPDGIDVYFDNVGGQILETVLFQMNQHGRVVCCGAVSQYNETAPTGPRNLPGMIVVKRLRMEGFIVMDFAEHDDAAVRQLSQWVTGGAVQVVEDIVEGLDAAPRALVGLLSGDNRGKRMVRVGPDPS
ncbi:MAG: NADP-dependent oxidoreductase [Pseudomonadota bacterium]